MVSMNGVGCFEVRSRPDRERVIVAVSGELDVASVKALKAALDELRDTGWNSVALDLRGLTFIDSSGLSLLLHAQRAARREHAAFAIVDGSPALARVLEIAGLEHHFNRARL